MSRDGYAQGESISARSFQNLRRLVLDIYDVGYGDRGYGQISNSNLAQLHPHLNWPHIVDDKSRNEIIRSWEWKALRNALSICLLHQGSDQSRIPPESVFESGKLITAQVGFSSKASGDMPFSIAEADKKRLTSDIMSMSLRGPIISDSRTRSWSSSITHTITVEFASPDDARYFFNSGGQLRFELSRTGEVDHAQDAFWTTFLSQIGQIGFGAKTADVVNQRNSCATGMGIGYYNLSTESQLVFRANGECVNMGPWPQMNITEGNIIRSMDISPSQDMPNIVTLETSKTIELGAASAEISTMSCDCCPVDCQPPPAPKRSQNVPPPPPPPPPQPEPAPRPPRRWPEIVWPPVSWSPTPWRPRGELSGYKISLGREKWAWGISSVLSDSEDDDIPKPMNVDGAEDKINSSSVKHSYELNAIRERSISLTMSRNETPREYPEFPIYQSSRSNFLLVEDYRWVQENNFSTIVYPTHKNTKLISIKDNSLKLNVEYTPFVVDQYYHDAPGLRKYWYVGDPSKVPRPVEFQNSIISSTNDIINIATESGPCCRNYGIPLVSRKLIQIGSGTASVVVTSETCSSISGELLVNVEYLTNDLSTSTYVPGDHNFYFLINITKNIDLFEMVSLQESIKDSIRTLINNGYEHSYMEIFSFAIDYTVLYQGVVRDFDFTIIDKITLTKETRSSVNNIFQYLIGQFKLKSSNQHHLVWFFTQAITDPSEVILHENMDSYVINWLNRNHNNALLKIGQVVEGNNPHDLKTSFRMLPIFNRTHPGELEIVEYWIDGTYLTEIFKLPQPVTLLNLYGLDHCQERTLFVRGKTTKGLVFELRHPINPVERTLTASIDQQLNKAINHISIQDQNGNQYFAYEMGTLKPQAWETKTLSSIHENTSNLLSISQFSTDEILKTLTHAIVNDLPDHGCPIRLPQGIHCGQNNVISFSPSDGLVITHTHFLGARTGGSFRVRTHFGETVSELTAIQNGTSIYNSGSLSGEQEFTIPWNPQIVTQNAQPLGRATHKEVIIGPAFGIQDPIGVWPQKKTPESVKWSNQVLPKYTSIVPVSMRLDIHPHIVDYGVWPSLDGTYPFYYYGEYIPLYAEFNGAGSAGEVYTIECGAHSDMQVYVNGYQELNTSMDRPGKWHRKAVWLTPGINFIDIRIRHDILPVLKGSEGANTSNCDGSCPACNSSMKVIRVSHSVFWSNEFNDKAVWVSRDGRNPVNDPLIVWDMWFSFNAPSTGTYRLNAAADDSAIFHFRSTECETSQSVRTGGNHDAPFANLHVDLLQGPQICVIQVANVNLPDNSWRSNPNGVAFTLYDPAGNEVINSTQTDQIKVGRVDSYGTFALVIRDKNGNVIKNSRETGWIKLHEHACPPTLKANPNNCQCEWPVTSPQPDRQFLPMALAWDLPSLPESEDYTFTMRIKDVGNVQLNGEIILEAKGNDPQYVRNSGSPVMPPYWGTYLIQESTQHFYKGPASILATVQRSDGGFRGDKLNFIIYNRSMLGDSWQGGPDNGFVSRHHLSLNRSLSTHMIGYDPEDMEGSGANDGLIAHRQILNGLSEIWRTIVLRSGGSNGLNPIVQITSNTMHGVSIIFQNAGAFNSNNAELLYKHFINYVLLHTTNIDLPHQQTAKNRILSLPGFYNIGLELSPIACNISADDAFAKEEYRNCECVNNTWNDPWYSAYHRWMIDDIFTCDDFYPLRNGSVWIKTGMEGMQGEIISYDLSCIYFDESASWRRTTCNPTEADLLLHENAREVFWTTWSRLLQNSSAMAIPGCNYASDITLSIKTKGNNFVVWRFDPPGYAGVGYYGPSFNLVDVKPKRKCFLWWCWHPEWCDELKQTGVWLADENGTPYFWNMRWDSAFYVINIPEEGYYRFEHACDNHSFFEFAGNHWHSRTYTDWTIEQPIYLKPGKDVLHIETWSDENEDAWLDEDWSDNPVGFGWRLYGPSGQLVAHSRMKELVLQPIPENMWELTLMDFILWTSYNVLGGWTDNQKKNLEEMKKKYEQKDLSISVGQWMTALVGNLPAPNQSSTMDYNNNARCISMNLLQHHKVNNDQELNVTELWNTRQPSLVDFYCNQGMSMIPDHPDPSWTPPAELPPYRNPGPTFGDGRGTDVPDSHPAWCLCEDEDFMPFRIRNKIRGRELQGDVWAGGTEYKTSRFKLSNGSIKFEDGNAGPSVSNAHQQLREIIFLIWSIYVCATDWVDETDNEDLNYNCVVPVSHPGWHPEFQETGVYISDDCVNPKMITGTYTRMRAVITFPRSEMYTFTYSSDDNSIWNFGPDEWAHGGHTDWVSRDIYVGSGTHVMDIQVYNHTFSTNWNDNPTGIGFKIYDSLGNIIATSRTPGVMQTKYEGLTMTITTSTQLGCSGSLLGQQPTPWRTDSNHMLCDLMNQMGTMFYNDFTLEHQVMISKWQTGSTNYDIARALDDIMAPPPGYSWDDPDCGYYLDSIQNQCAGYEFWTSCPPRWNAVFNTPSKSLFKNEQIVTNAEGMHFWTKYGFKPFQTAVYNEINPDAPGGSEHFIHWGAFESEHRYRCFWAPMICPPKNLVYTEEPPVAQFPYSHIIPTPPANWTGQRADVAVWVSADGTTPYGLFGDYVYAAGHFTVSETKQYVLYVAADDWVNVYIDGNHVASRGCKGGTDYMWHKLYIGISAGSHTVTCSALNDTHATLPPIYSQNAGWWAIAIAEEKNTDVVYQDVVNLSYGSWHPEMNSCAVWVTNDGEPVFSEGEYVTVKYNIPIPVDGNYTFGYAADNVATFDIGGYHWETSTFTEWKTITVTLTAGTHTFVVMGWNEPQGSTEWNQNPQGFGWKLFDPSGTFITDSRNKSLLITKYDEIIWSSREMYVPITCSEGLNPDYSDRKCKGYKEAPIVVPMILGHCTCSYVDYNVDIQISTTSSNSEPKLYYEVLCPGDQELPDFWPLDTWVYTKPTGPQPSDDAAPDEGFLDRDPEGKPETNDPLCVSIIPATIVPPGNIRGVTPWFDTNPFQPQTITGGHGIHRQSFNFGNFKGTIKVTFDFGKNGGQMEIWHGIGEEGVLLGATANGKLEYNQRMFEVDYIPFATGDNTVEIMVIFKEPPVSNPLLDLNTDWSYDVEFEPVDEITTLRFDPDKCIKSWGNSVHPTFRATSDTSTNAESEALLNRNNDIRIIDEGDTHHWMQVQNMYEANTVEIWAKTNDNGPGINGDKGHILTFDVILRDNHSNNSYHDVVTGSIINHLYIFKASTYLGVKDPINITSITPFDSSVPTETAPSIDFQIKESQCPGDIPVYVEFDPEYPYPYRYLVHVSHPAWGPGLNQFGIWVSNDGSNPLQITDTPVYIHGSFRVARSGEYVLWTSIDNMMDIKINGSSVWNGAGFTDWFRTTIVCRTGTNTIEIAAQNVGENSHTWVVNPAGIAFKITHLDGTLVCHSRQTGVMKVPFNCPVGLEADYVAQKCKGYQSSTQSNSSQWGDHLQIGYSTQVTFRWNVSNAHRHETMWRITGGDCRYKRSSSDNGTWITLPRFHGEYGPVELFSNDITGCSVEYTIAAHNTRTGASTSRSVYIDFIEIYCPSNMTPSCGQNCYGTISTAPSYLQNYGYLIPINWAHWIPELRNTAVWVSNDNITPLQVLDEWIGIVCQIETETGGLYTFEGSADDVFRWIINGVEIMRRQDLGVWHSVSVQIPAGITTVEIQGMNKSEFGPDYSSNPGGFGGLIRDPNGSVIFNTRSFVGPIAGTNRHVMLPITFHAWTPYLNQYAMWYSNDGINPVQIIDQEVLFTGIINAPISGTYTLYHSCDNIGWFTLGGVRTTSSLTNWAAHTVYLEAGNHVIEAGVTNVTQPDPTLNTWSSNPAAIAFLLLGPDNQEICNSRTPGLLHYKQPLNVTNGCGVLPFICPNGTYPDLSGCYSPSCKQTVVQAASTSPCLCPPGFQLDGWGCSGEIRVPPAHVFTHDSVMPVLPNPYSVWFSKHGNRPETAKNRWFTTGWTIHLPGSENYLIKMETDGETQLLTNGMIIGEANRGQKFEQNVYFETGYKTFIIKGNDPQETYDHWTNNRAWFSIVIKNSAGNIIWTTRSASPDPYACPDGFRPKLGQTSCYKTERLPCGTGKCPDGFHFNTNTNNCVPNAQYIIETNQPRPDAAPRNNLVYVEEDELYPYKCIIPVVHESYSSEVNNYAVWVSTDCINPYVSFDQIVYAFGDFNLAEAGTYRLHAHSDDWMQMSINGQTVFTGGSQGHPGHNFSVSNIDLPAGVNHIEIQSKNYLTGSLQPNWRTNPGCIAFLITRQDGSVITHSRIPHLLKIRVVCKEGLEPDQANRKCRGYIDPRSGISPGECRKAERPKRRPKTSKPRTLCPVYQSCCGKGFTDIWRWGAYRGDDEAQIQKSCGYVVLPENYDGKVHIKFHQPNKYPSMRLQVVYCGNVLYNSGWGQFFRYDLRDKASKIKKSTTWEDTYVHAHVCVNNKEGSAQSRLLYVFLEANKPPGNNWQDSDTSYNLVFTYVSLDGGSGCPPVTRGRFKHPDPNRKTVSQYNESHKWKTCDGVPADISSAEEEGIYPYDPYEPHALALQSRGIQSGHLIDPTTYEDNELILAENPNRFVTGDDSYTFPKIPTDDGYTDYEDNLENSTNMCPHGYIYNSITGMCDPWNLPYQNSDECMVLIKSNENISMGYSFIDTGDEHPILDQGVMTLFYNGKEAKPEDVRGKPFFTNKGWIIFNPNEYLELNPEILQYSCSPEHHFIQFGAWESVVLGRCISRTPSPFTPSGNKVAAYIDNDKNRNNGYTISNGILHYRGKKATPTDILNKEFYTTAGWIIFDPVIYTEFIHKLPIQNVQLPSINIIEIANHFIHIGAELGQEYGVGIGVQTCRIEDKPIQAYYLNDQYNQSNGWTLVPNGPGESLYYNGALATVDDLRGAKLSTTLGIVTFNEEEYSNISSNIDIKGFIRNKVKFLGNYIITTPTEHFILVGASQGRPISQPYWNTKNQGCYIDNAMNRNKGWTLQDHPDQSGKYLAFNGKMATSSDLINAEFFTNRARWERFDPKTYAAINNFRNVDDAIIHFISYGAYEGQFGRVFAGP